MTAVHFTLKWLNFCTLKNSLEFSSKRLGVQFSSAVCEANKELRGALNSLLQGLTSVRHEADFRPGEWSYFPRESICYRISVAALCIPPRPGTLEVCIIKAQGCRKRNIKTRAVQTHPQTRFYIMEQACIFKWDLLISYWCSTDIKFIDLAFAK